MQNKNVVRRISIILLSAIGLIILLIGVALKISADEENAELRSVVVRAKIINDQHYKSNSEYSVGFKYKGVQYTNSLQANHNVFKLNDSINIKIDSKSPLEYCEVVN